MARETAEAAAARWKELEVLQTEYKDFRKFLFVVMTQLLGFNCTWIQLDIATFLQFGPQYIMIQAQRGQAKTTVTAAFAVWCLIHNPSMRILIVSANDDMATEIAGWVIQIMKGLPELECMLPDITAGDRSSVKRFDVHYTLKGAEKSPSIKCRPITGGLSGNRADLLIADDIENPKNSKTELMRSDLIELTREFTSICSTGRIVYLGTPQSQDSMYNTLPARGYVVRVWPGRYPTLVEEDNYHGTLAPLIQKRMMDDPALRSGGGPTGDRGKPTDPELLDEATLTKKELDQGPAYFQLQHMLDTRLMDADRYPLKTEELVVLQGSTERLPVSVYSSPSEDRRLSPPSGFPLKLRLYRAASTAEEQSAPIGVHMFIDPAGGGANGDETGWAVTACLGGFVWLLAVGGIPGGADEDKMNTLVDIICKWKPHTLGIEKNFSYGIFASVLMQKVYKRHKCSIVEPWASGQKELRIIKTLEPLLGAGKLIIDPRAIDADWASVQHYPPAIRASYSFLHQFARLTREKGALLHDDRVDAVAGACEYWVDAIRQDSEKAAASAQTKAWRDKWKDPLGDGRPLPGFQRKPKNSVASRLAIRRS